jgi:type I restriction enzyme S subunit
MREALENLVQPRSERVSPADRPDDPYIGLEHVQAHTNQILGTVPASSMASSSASFDIGDVLYGRMRPYLNKVVRPMFAGLASAEFIVFPESDALDSKFLLKRLSSADFVKFACSQYEGDRPRVKFDALGKFQIDLPPPAEQTRIVAKLEELLSDLDAGVAELKAAQKKLAQYRQSLLKAAVEGALTAEWREKQKPVHPDSEPVEPIEGLSSAHGSTSSPRTDESETGAQLLQRILAERRARWEAKQLAKFKEQGKAPPKDWQKKYPEPVEPDTTGLPELPEGWVWASVDQLLADIETGKSFKCEERPPHDHEVGVVKVSAVSWGDYDEQESKTCHDESMVRPELFVNAGDFLFSRANTIELVGACVIAKAVTKRIMLSDKILRLVLVKEELKAWLLTLLRSEFGRKYIEQLASGNQESMRNIGQERLRQIPVPLPCFGEITMVSELLSANIMAADEQEQAINLSLKQSNAQRQNILRAAFAGQLVPQDPNDEPASVLLERIRAERAAGGAMKKPRGRKAKEAA